MEILARDKTPLNLHLITVLANIISTNYKINTVHIRFIKE